MKKLNLILAFFMAFVATGITSCDVEPVDSELLNNPVPNPNNPNPNNPNNPNNPSTGTFTVDFNGQTFVATQVQAYVTGGLMGIQGLRGTNGEAVSLVMPADGEGVYTADNDLLMNYTPSEDDEYGYTNISFSTGETSGTVTITDFDEVNHTISGTFSFTGWYGDEEAGIAPIVFSNGTFTDVPFEMGEPTTDTFSATVNGVPYGVENIITATAGEDPDMVININVLDDELNNLAIAIKDELPLGTYSFNGFTPDFDITGSITMGDVEYVANSGSLTITSKTATNITGTFNFVAQNGEGETITVTQGAFNVDYE